MSVRSQMIHQHGLEAELYLPSQGTTYPIAVLVFAGSSGGLRHRELAHHLAENNIPALALAYFAYKTLPPTLSNIPLEYFIRALQQVRLQPELRHARLVAMGSSRGAELVLQLASQDPEIQGVIATSPSHVRWGATGQAGAAWTWAGQPLPYVQTIADDVFVPRTDTVDGIPYVRYREWYAAQIEHNPSVDAATIEVERVNEPLLLFSGGDDQLWPATRFADAIAARAQNHGFGYPVINVQYEHVGHVFPLPGQPPVLHTIHPALGSGIAYGGTFDSVTHAARDRWNTIVSFLHDMK